MHGDTVNITKKGLIINGSLQQDGDNVTGETLPYENKVKFPIKCEEGQVFVLADNRDNATDGRVFGTLDEKDTLGKVFSIMRLRDV